MNRRQAVVNHDVHHQAPPTVPIVASQPTLSAAAANVCQPASADLISLTPNNNSYGDLIAAATLFPDSEQYVLHIGLEPFI